MDKALNTMISNMPEKTGKSLEEWKKLLTQLNFSKHTEAVNYLKKEHQVTHGFANTIVSLSKNNETTDDELLKQQYAGKENLKAIYHELINYIDSLGNDVKIVPKKSSVSIIRKNQFVLIKPTTKIRMDLGLKIKDKPASKRLENSGPFGSMCTHRVQLFKPEEVNDELKEWIQEAYHQSI